MIDNGIEINDLYSVINEKQEKFIRQDDLIYATEEGVEALVKQIVEKT
jgi:hypothetical protein